MDKRAVWVAAILFTIAVAFVKAREICIDEMEGKDTLNCIDQRKRNCCFSLIYVVNTLKERNLRGNNHIAMAGNITISGIVEVVYFTNLTIESEEKYFFECNSTLEESGFIFESVFSLTLRNIGVLGCSIVTNTTTNAPRNITLLIHSMSAILVVNSHSVLLENVTIAFNYGTGMVMYDTGGNVEVLNSVFEGNEILPISRHPGGGGLYIEFSCRSFLSAENSLECINTMEGSSYIISNSTFKNNYVIEHEPHLTQYSYYNKGAFQGLGRGGGLCIILNGNSSNNTIEITDCKFTNNRATTWGGGAYISPRHNLCNNTIIVRNTNFTNNKCTMGGGGGMKLSFLSYRGHISYNQVQVMDCHFINNTAKTNGGGLAIVSSRESKISNIKNHLDNTIEFHDCVWRDNMAELGSAIDMSPGIWDVLGNGLFPVPSFKNCRFESNSISKSVRELSEGVTVETSGVATMIITSFAVIFYGFMHFKDNLGTSIYLQSGLVTLTEYSELIVTGNKAKNGGAIAFIGFSVMYLEPNTRITLKNNTAKLLGGALYVKSVDQHDRFSSRSCFLQRSEKPHGNVIIAFGGNSADTGIGNTIFASSIKSCDHTCDNSNMHSILGCAANFTGFNNVTGQVSTNVVKFEYSEADLKENEIIPGRFFKIPLTSYDEFNKSVNTVFDLSLKETNTVKLKEDRTSPYLSNTDIRLYGERIAGENELELEKDENTIHIKIKTTECPPGHYHENSLCVCKVNHFRGIWKCSNSRKTASIINGFWIGLCQHQKQCAGFCPQGFCTDNITTELNTTINETSRLICAKNREGKLCGSCSENNSAYYHSVLKKCGSEKLCKYGILFYIVSELLPLTVLFLVAIISNVSFTSGSATGFILYAQILHSLHINTYKVVHLGGFIHSLSSAQHFFYNTFNLNFFNLEHLSFCLWRGATTLDTLAWTYVTIAYTLVLISLTVWLLNRAVCHKICICWRPHTLKNAVIHGLTAFLVMSYSQCARVSFQILSTTHLAGYDFKRIETVIRYSGEQRPFDHVHVWYGFVAITFIFFMVILPPLFLVLYPLCLKCLAFCHLSERAWVTILANKIPMPLFDAFQSCFKDQYRFFSGLYFFYRVIPLILYMVAPDMVIYYILLESFLIMILTVHATLQPYKNPKHNIIDTLLFGNLAVINALSLLNYQKVIESKDDLMETKKIITIATLFQQFFIFLPLLLAIAYCVWAFLVYAVRKLKEQGKSRLTSKHLKLVDSIELPPLRSTTASPASAARNPLLYHELITK